MVKFSGWRGALPACLLAAALTALASSRSEARPFTAADLVALDRVSDPQLSPDGSLLLYQLRIANVAANSARQELWLVETNGASRPHRAPGVPDGASLGRWAPDGRSIYFTAPKDGATQLWRISPDGSNLRQVTSLPVNVGLFKLSPDGRTLIVSLAVFPDCPTLQCTRERLTPATGAPTGQRYVTEPVRVWDTWNDHAQNRLFALQLQADGVAVGSPRPLTEKFYGEVPSRPDGDDGDFTITSDSNSVIFTAFDARPATTWGTNYDLYSVPIDGSRAPENLTAANKAVDAEPVISPDGRLLAYFATKRPGHQADRQAIMIRNLRTSTLRELAPGWDRSPETMSWSGDGRTLFAIARDNGQSRIFAIDVASGMVRPITGNGRVTGLAIAGKTLVYGFEDLKSPTQYFRATDKTPVALTDHNRERLHGVSFGDFEQFTFKGWADEDVRAYVVKPADFEPGKTYPVAFLIHGGPQGSLSNFFDYRWNAQTYAGAGYAVVMVDFHGSRGYGQRFQDSVSDHWGDRPLEDLRKGWDEALRRYSFLDGNRACALGASYGGYMIDWMASQWKAPWKCFVNHSGIFDYRMNSYSIDLFSFMEWENGGPPYERPDHARFNPADHVDQWSVPMLVTHGGKDFRVDIGQGIATFAALQRRGIPSEFIYYPDENHRILKPGNYLQWHNAVEEWLRRWTRAGQEGTK